MYVDQFPVSISINVLWYLYTDVHVYNIQINEYTF